MDRLTKKEQKELRKQDMQEKIKKENRNNFIKKAGLWIGGTLVLVLALWGLIQVVNTPQSQTLVAEAPAVTNSDIIYGSPSAKVTVIEYADFQCPACSIYAPFVNKLKQDFKGDIRIAYRFFPLPQHPYGMTASKAAYATHLQGKFWEMYSLLYDNQNTWSQSKDPASIFKQYAQELSLDLDKYEKDMNSKATEEYIKSQQNSATAIGVNSTPTFFINGKQIQNPPTYEAFKKLVEEELKNK